MPSRTGCLNTEEGSDFRSKPAVLVGRPGRQTLGKRDSAEMQDELVGGQTSVQVAPGSGFQVV